MSRRKEFIFVVLSVFLIVISVGVILFLVESGSRAISARQGRQAGEKRRRTAQVTVATEYYPKYKVGFHVPNQDFIDSNVPSRLYHVTINSFGFRGREITMKKPRNTVRIMVLGDSFTYGDGVENEQTLPVRMEDLLNRGNNKMKYEVINAGYMGADLESETNLFQNYGVLFKPDVLVLAFCYNDIAGIVYSQFYEHNIYSYPDAVMDNSSGLTRLALRVLRNSAFFNFLLRKRAEMIYRKEVEFLKDKTGRISPGTMIEPFEKGKNQQIEKAVVVYKSGLLAFRDYLSGRNIRLLFILFPTPIENKDIRRPINKELYDFAAENGILALDLRDAWLARNPNIFSSFDIDTHPNAPAVELTAEEVVKKLSTGNMLQR